MMRVGPSAFGGACSSREKRLAQFPFYVGKQFTHYELAAAAKEPHRLSNSELITAAIHGAATVGCCFGEATGISAGPRTQLQVLEDELRRRLDCEIAAAA